MPRLSAFYGIVIWMYYSDHNPPHFHAQYGEHWAKVEIETGEVFDGFLPSRAASLVAEWVSQHRRDLVTDWLRAREGQPLEPIPPLS